jgi:hypothetical protein
VLMRCSAHPSELMDLGRKQTAFLRRHRWLPWAAGSLISGVILLAVAVEILAHRAEPFARERMVRALAERFHARVELDSLKLSLGNSLHGEWGVWADGQGLRIWPPAEVKGINVPGPDHPPLEPLIQLAEFRFHVPLHYRSGSPVHVGLVHLRGLEIRIPPKSRMRRIDTGSDSNEGNEKKSHTPIPIQIDKIECNGAYLELQTDKPGKLPLRFVIKRFTVKGIRSGHPMNFEAELTNPKPPGEINSSGSFGPWNGEDLGESPVKGDYRFDHADLSVFKGIAGMLNSKGHYEGTLRELTVDGETDTPDFQLSHFGTKMDLRTSFHAKVDGTNGDTWLEPVSGTIGSSHFNAEGQIVRVLAAGQDGKAHSRGHDIALKITVDRARIEDFLHLASRSYTPILTGDVNVKAALHIPPGPVPVHEKMTLKGQFSLDDAEFTDLKVQDKVRELSRRAQGKHDTDEKSDLSEVKSQMHGDFIFGGGALKLPSITYTVPGADIQLHGAYQIPANNLNFSGQAKLQATVSQAVGGWKGKLLIPADPFFRKDGAGTVIPIYISGPREKPQFGFDFSHHNGTHPQRPGVKE